MLSEAEVKDWVHRGLGKSDQLLVLLAGFDKPVQITKIRALGLKVGLRDIKNWNVSALLGSSQGRAIRPESGWELADKGRLHLRGLGVGSLSPAAVQVAVDLRAHLNRILDPETKAFVEESIRCYEAGLYRSAIVMTWLAAVYVLQKEVVAKYLNAFNAEAKRVDGRWKAAITTDGLGVMNEFEFLERLVAISVIGKNVKDELQKALKLRNGCGHPSSLKVSANMAASHIELLLLNVFDVFNP